MSIEFKTNIDISVDEFIHLLRRSTLAKRRPIDDHKCLEGMLTNSNLVISAWEKDQLVGISRCITDFHYACYLSDLAVDKAYQNKGIGKQLQVLTQQQLGPKCKLILIAAPDANTYYEHIGFTNNQRCWVLQRNEEINR